jgi:hypothetical protein
LGLAVNTGCESGNNNIYMKITDKGDYLIENFKNLADYQVNLEKEKSKNNVMNNYTTNNIIDSKIENSNINQGTDLKNISNIIHLPPTQPIPEKSEKTISKWAMIPEWAKILGGIGAFASLIKVIIELNK